MPYRPDYSKYFYEASCEFYYIDGCQKSNPSASNMCPDFETCFLERNPGVMLASPLSNGNAKGSAAVSKL